MGIFTGCPVRRGGGTQPKLEMDDDLDEVNVVRSRSCLEVLSTRKMGFLSRSSSSSQFSPMTPASVVDRLPAHGSSVTSSFHFHSAQRRANADKDDDTADDNDPDRITYDGLWGIKNNDPDRITFDGLQKRTLNPQSFRRNQLKFSVEQQLMKSPAKVPELHPPRRKCVSDFGWRRPSEEEHAPADIQEEHEASTQDTDLLHALCEERSIELVHMNDVEVHCKIGVGGTSEVYKATWKGKYVATKHMCDTAERRILLHEIRMASFIGEHENLISMLGVCADSPLPIIVYSLQEGWTLKDVIAYGGQELASTRSFNMSRRSQKKGISKEELCQSLRWMADLTAALDFLHSRAPPIAHRDVKPGNLMLSADHSRLKLGDYGLCKHVTRGPAPAAAGRGDAETPGATGHAETSGATGSFRYMAPEVYLGLQGRDEKVDIWSCGVVMWAVAVRRIPFELVVDTEVARLVACEKLLPPLALVRHRGLQHIIAGALVCAPAARPTACALHAALLVELSAAGHRAVTTGSFSFKDNLKSWIRAARLPVPVLLPALSRSQSQGSLSSARGHWQASGRAATDPGRASASGPGPAAASSSSSSSPRAQGASRMLRASASMRDLFRSTSTPG